MALFKKDSQYGLTDINSQGIDDDLFDIKSYIYGLKDFIVTCNTPMTIAIQGDWGTGKTSIMEMVIDALEKPEKEGGESMIIPIKFNTWEYSQFNLASQLSLVMIEALINETKNAIEEKAGDESKKKIAVSADKIRNFIGVLATASLSIATKGMVQLDEKNLSALLPSASNTGISELKENFNNIVAEATQGGKKLVIFIDDLDRLDPAVAVEILEILKIFLESENCVFVLAIDYAVVQRGVKAKYGSDFDEEKGKNFFDKIIQVPFQVPVGNYNLKKFIDACIDETEIGEKIKARSDKLIALIEASVGKNPRAIKRVFNALLLLKMVDQNPNEANPKSSVFADTDKTILLFAMLCLQQCCPPIYEFFSMNRDNIDGEKLDILNSLDYSRITSELEIDMKQEELDKIRRFIPELYGIVDKNNSHNISDEDEIPVLKEVLALTAVTGNSGIEGRYTSQDITNTDIVKYCTYKDNTPNQFELFAEAIEITCSDSHISRKKANSGYIEVRGDFNKRGTTFCSLCERQTGAAVYFYVPSKNAIKSIPEELTNNLDSDIILNINPENRYIRVNLDATIDRHMEYFKKMVFFCYEEYLKKQ